MHMISLHIFLGDDVSSCIHHLDVGLFIVPGIDCPEIKLESDLVETNELIGRNDS